VPAYLIALESSEQLCALPGKHGTTNELNMTPQFCISCHNLVLFNIAEGSVSEMCVISR
jgi:hypothetical protein